MRTLLAALFLLSACNGAKYDGAPKAELIDARKCPAEHAAVSTLDDAIAGRVETAATADAAAAVAGPCALATAGICGAVIGVGLSAADYDTTALREERAIERAVARMKGCAREPEPQAPMS